MSHRVSNPNPALQLPQRFAPALPPAGHTPKTSPLDTVQLRSPDEFPLNHFRNLRKENKVTTSAAVELQGSLCCYSFSQGHTWLNALTGKSFNVLLEHLSEVFFCLLQFALFTLQTRFLQALSLDPQLLVIVIKSLFRLPPGNLAPHW